MTILVLGMHRSGTSAITKLIGDMGAYIGDDLLPASPDNSYGFWERNDVLAINRAILKSQNCNWYHVDGFDSGRPLPPELVAPMQKVADEFSQHIPFAVKDPRFCLTLPYWLPFFSNKPVIVHAIREANAVADSLFKRNQMPNDQGLALRERYLNYMQQNTKGLAVVTCKFEHLMARPMETAKQLHQQLSKHVIELGPVDISSLKSSRI